jgi:hypothetical protein
MSRTHDNAYAIGGDRYSDQAQPSSANRGAGTVQMRMLIELQVQTLLMAKYFDSKEDIRQLRQDVADSIT